jgi:hypothetical protein
MSLVKEFKPTLSMLPEHKNSEETEKQHQLFKGFFKRSINRVIYK